MSDTKPPLRVLVVGESWIKHTVHLKGFDQFHTTEYEEGAGVFLGRTCRFRLRGYLHPRARNFEPVSQEQGQHREV